MKTIQILNAVLVIFFLSSAQGAYVVQEKTTSSNITVREVRKDNFEIRYCKQGADSCVHLGSKSSYTLAELQRIKNRQVRNTAISGVAMVVGIVVGAYAGVFVSAPTVFISGSSPLASMSVIGGAVIASGGVNLVDRFNPLKQVRYLTFATRTTSKKLDRVKDIDELAIWLNKQLIAL